MINFCEKCGSMILPGSTKCKCGWQIHLKDMDEIENEERPVIENRHITDIKSADELDSEARKELEEHCDYFDSYRGLGLDEQQRIAAVADGDSIQIIAGAGTGKTFTLVAKISYLLDIKKVNPDRILCLSFSKPAVCDLNKKLDSRIEVRTFHSLGLDIVNQNLKHYYMGVGSEEFGQIYDSYLETLSDMAKSRIMDFCKDFKGNIVSDDLKEGEDEFKSVLSNAGFKTIIKQFTDSFKKGNYSLESFKKFDKINQEIYYGNRINSQFFSIAESFIRHYESVLHRNHWLHFSDMINRAVELVEKTDMDYDYIFVDEYQDTSQNNYRLIKAIKEKTGAKLVVVGDDWQSIYGFRKCKVELFSKFENYFPNPKRVFIEKTYRNPQELIDVAGKFIMQSDNMIKKSLKSDRHVEKPVKIVYLSRNPQIKRQYIFDLVKKLSKESSEVLILGRYRDDILPITNFTKLIKRGNISKDRYYEITDKEEVIDNVHFRTVHGAKGLEADNVIISNVMDGYAGFPSKVEGYSFNNILFNWSGERKHEEERRLFYVALTRSRNSVYILTEKNKESEFIREIINSSPENIECIDIDSLEK